MNAVVETQKIETVFDHNITEDEFKLLFDFKESQEDYEYALSQIDAHIDLHYLYELRGNLERAQFYLNQLDEKTRNQLTMRCCLS